MRGGIMHRYDWLYIALVILVVVVILAILGVV